MRVVMLTVDRPGHVNGGQPANAWCARITGSHPKYGLSREFVPALKDWSRSRKAWSGNVYGITVSFPLREGELYEVQHYAGRRGRDLVREFVRVVDGKTVSVANEDAAQLVAEMDG